MLKTRQVGGESSANSIHYTCILIYTWFLPMKTKPKPKQPGNHFTGLWHFALWELKTMILLNGKHSIPRWSPSHKSDTEQLQISEAIQALNDIWQWWTWSNLGSTKENLKPTGLLQIKISYTQTIKLKFQIYFHSSTMVHLTSSKKKQTNYKMWYVKVLIVKRKVSEASLT